jgi:hypothetical protein
MDDLARLREDHHAGDAYFCIHELEKLATWFWKSGGSKYLIRDFVSQLMKIYNKLPSIQKEQGSLASICPEEFSSGASRSCLQSIILVCK